MPSGSQATTGDFPAASSGEDPRTAGFMLGERYLLVEPIGQGGMAQVWRAQDLTLHRAVAVKFLKLAGDPTVVRARFLREARAAAAVRHRYVVDILDFGAAPDGTPFMVMELVGGRTLTTRLYEGEGLSLADVVRIASRLLAGLDAVHAAGIVHGDLKPDNVVLLADGGAEDTPKLLDFGISRLNRRDDTNRPRSVVPTEERDILGTPPYMSPEQAGGVEMDHRSDLFTVGTMLYEMLSGARPFDDENPLRIVAAVRDAQPIPLSSLRPDLPPEIVGVVARAMARTPAERFASAAEMRHALLDAAKAYVAARAEDALVGDGSLAPAGDAKEVELALADHGSDPVDPRGAPTLHLERGAPPIEQGARARVWMALAVAGVLLLVVLGAAGLATWSGRGDQSRAIPLPAAPSTPGPAPGPASPATITVVEPGAPSTASASQVSANGATAEEGESLATPAAPPPPGAAHPPLRPPRGSGAARRRADLVRDPGF